MQPSPASKVDRITQLSIERSELMGRRLEGWKIRPLVPSEEARLQELDTEIAMASQEQCDEAAKKLPQEAPEKGTTLTVSGRLKGATGLQGEQSDKALLIGMVEAVLPSDATEADVLEIYTQLGDLCRELAPQDAIEAMLVSQIVTLQKAGMQLLGRATRQNSSPRWASTCLNGACKLFARAQNALQLLEQHRRGGRQTVVVERVNVQQGGTAAFGSFQATQGVQPQNRSHFDRRSA